MKNTTNDETNQDTEWTECERGCGRPWGHGYCGTLCADCASMEQDEEES